MPAKKPKEKRNVFYQSPFICVRRNTKRGRGGRGVYATQDIKKGETLEIVPCILMPESQVYPEGFDTTTQFLARISWYVFGWPFKEKGQVMVAIALGYGSLYNHSYKANAEYLRYGKDFMHFVAIKNIKKGEEIFVNYNGSPNDKTRLEFKVNK